MTVLQLKDLLATLPVEADGAEIVIPTSDHGYKKARAMYDKAELTKAGELFEYWGDDHIEKGSKVVQILEVR